MGRDDQPELDILALLKAGARAWVGKKKENKISDVEKDQGP